MPWAHVWLGIFPIGEPSTVLTLAMFSAIAGIGNGAFMSIPFAMVADAADEGQLTTDQQQEGLYFGLYTFAYKFGISISVLIGGVDAVLFSGVADIQLLTIGGGTLKARRGYRQGEAWQSYQTQLANLG